MGELPRANTSVDAEAGAGSTGTDLICVMAPVPQGADLLPKGFGSAKALLAQYGYSEGAEYAALHYDATGKPVLFVGLPISVPGELSRFDNSSNTGTSVVTAAVGPDGSLTEHDGVVKVKTGGTVGTDQILLEVSMDQGRSFRPVRLSTGTSYTVPYIGVVVSFAAGTLIAGDTVLTWHGTGPLSAQADWITARQNLASQDRLFRSVMLAGDLQNNSDAAAYTAQMNAYETSDERFIYGRASVLDRLPQAIASKVVNRMTGNPSLTFTEVGATGDTITRATGSWLADNFAVGDIITVSGAGAGNNFTSIPIAGVTATVITLDTDDLADEVGIQDVTIVTTPSLTFAEVGATGDTITRNRGSFIADGFRIGDILTIAGTVSNDATHVTAVTGVTATVITLDTDDLVDEAIGSDVATISSGETKAAWMARIDSEFASIAADFRVDLSAGRGRVSNPINGWNLRRPAGWAVSLREYQNDLHIATWRKKDGNVGFDLYDADRVLVEWDDASDGAAGSAARFTTLRTYKNGPNGAYIAQSLTREADGSLLSQTHNVAVVNLTCTTTQKATEDAIGESLILNADGTATGESLKVIEAMVNRQLNETIMQNALGQGARASSVVWRANTDDILNTPTATLTGVTTLILKGTIHSINTIVKVS